MVVFEPGLGMRIAPGAGTQQVRCVWPSIDDSHSQGASAEECNDETPAGAPPPSSLLFDEDEVARLCAAAAAAARTRVLSEEAARLQERVAELGRNLAEELAALRADQMRALQQARQRAGSMLAEAFARLAPEVLLETHKAQLAREIAQLLPLFVGAGTVRVCVAASVAEPLAAGLQSRAGNGLEIEVVQDPAAPAGTLRLECGATRLEHDPAAFVARIAEALRTVLASEQHPTPESVAALGPMADLRETVFTQRNEGSDGA